MNNQECSGEQLKEIGWTVFGYVMNEADSGRLRMKIDDMDLWLKLC